MKKIVSNVAAIVFLAVGVYLFYQAGYDEGGPFDEGPSFDLGFGLLFSCLPFGLSALCFILGAKSGKKKVEEKSNDAEKSLTELRDKGLLSEEEYQRKLKMSKPGVQNSMDDLKSLRDGGILTEEEYQQKVNQLLK